MQDGAQRSGIQGISAKVVETMLGEVIYSVFVSSTYEDLREERAAVQKALLQLHCMPIGMELFGSADEETWEFIKRQIDNSDYYVVIVAGKYGSTAADGVSYTEKEYDYARAIRKPVLGFVHGSRGSITRDKSEDDPEKRSKLEAFIEKVRRSPVSFFMSSQELATQVTLSFANFRNRHPAVGFIRADQVPDLKRHAETLEENSRLRNEISRLRLVEPKPDPVREARRKLLLRTLNDPRWTWRTLDILSHTIGEDDKAITKALLVEVGAQASEDGQDLWALITRLDGDAPKQTPDNPV
jgi:hypothetical protein